MELLSGLSSASGVFNLGVCGLMQLDISERVASIKQALTAQSDEKAKSAVRKFIPTSQHVYGVRLPLLNQIVKEHRAGGFELSEALWKSGAFEEKLLAAKLLGSSCKKDPDRALTLAKNLLLRLATGRMRYSRNGRSERNSQRKTDRTLCLVKQANQIKEPVGASPSGWL